MNKVAVIGATGFIGRHLTDRLLREKDLSVVLYGRTEMSSLSVDAEYRQIDFQNRDKMKNDFAGTDVVYYLASETIPATSWQNPILEIEKNLLPFLSFLEVITSLGVKKVVFVSSAGTIYGATNGKVTEASDKKPFSPYGIIKLSMENFLNYYHVKCGLSYDIFRVSNVYGEGQNTAKGLGIINTFLEKIITDKKVKVFGDGSSTRNYIYVKDVAELLMYSLKSSGSSDVYNISSNATYNIKELIAILKETVAESFDVEYEDGRRSDNSFIDLDNSKILSRVPGFAFTDIREGIFKTYQFLKTKK
jgi:UDP-glucose 4-epimerase